MKTKIPPPIITLTFAAIMWLISSQLAIGHVLIPGTNVIAIFVALVGVAVVGLAIRDFQKAGTTINPHTPAAASELVSKGIFNRSRNPMYLGMLIVLTAFAIWLGSALNIAMLILFVWSMTMLQIKPEEEALSEVFGQAYADYRARVRRWI